MAASKAFNKILDCVKSSNLNFCLQLSPFSANISLKKTLVKDKAGFYLTLLPATYFQNYLFFIIHPKISCIGYIFAY